MQRAVESSMTQDEVSFAVMSQVAGWRQYDPPLLGLGTCPVQEITRPVPLRHGRIEVAVAGPPGELW